MVDSLSDRRSNCATGPRQEGLGCGTHEDRRRCFRPLPLDQRDQLLVLQVAQRPARRKVHDLRSVLKAVK